MTWRYMRCLFRPYPAQNSTHICCSGGAGVAGGGGDGRGGGGGGDGGGGGGSGGGGSRGGGGLGSSTFAAAPFTSTAISEGLADTAGNVIGCLLTQCTRVQLRWMTPQDAV